MNQLKTDLVNALKLIDEPRKWGRIRYRRWDPDNRVHCYCAVGALIHAITIEDKRAGKVTEMLSSTAVYEINARDRTRLDDACELILEVIHADSHRLLDRPAHTEVSKWNDDPMVWHVDVVRTFEEAIQIAAQDDE